ncbi:hypothetical protein H0H92_013015 [Tricholoma furcatifolium]|nr:hypothetical protein H0H92_009378 [Tricholoma furcatifolium]KAG6822664.1 hypothetical protein H0H92_013015 [Tricholoma furcatifolium]
MQWAASNGYLYVIHLLIFHNADPTATDSQGYNSLHLVKHSSFIMPLLYLLRQSINVDSRDAQGHTSLMWAAYQGFAGIILGSIIWVVYCWCPRLVQQTTSHAFTRLLILVMLNPGRAPIPPATGSSSPLLTI